MRGQSNIAPLTLETRPAFKLTLADVFAAGDALSLSADTFPISENKPYVYIPLQHGSIRVLDLLPGTPGSDLHLSIRHENSNPGRIAKYETLSYVWGSMRKTQTVTVQGHTQDERWFLSVTDNLSIALQNLRSATDTRTIWVDAICIDQSNLAERQCQVARMHEIYRNASRVVVWLGPEDEDSGEALKVLESVGNIIEIDWLTRNIKPLPGTATTSDERARITKFGPALQVEQLRAARRLLRRAWFSRLWIRQEIGLANGETAMVMCGRHNVGWETFKKGGWLLYSNRFCTAEPLSVKDAVDLSAGVKCLVDVIEGSRAGLSLGHFFSLCRQAECGYPRDRIYANLGLIDERDRRELGVLPDYTLSTADVYRKFAERAMAVSGLALLKYCVGPAKVEGLPSWVPDWSVHSNPVWFSTLSSAYMGSNEMICVEGPKLRCTGALCGMLAGILPPLGIKSVADSELIDYLRDMLNSWPGSFRTYIGRVRAFWLVLGARDFAELRIPPRGYNLSLETCIRSPDPDSGSGYDAGILRPFLIIYPPTRRMAFTRNNNLCLVPEAAQVGDEVWDLLGVGSLMVLRPTGDTTYQVIGKGWVDGYCSNEALLGPLPGGFEVARGLPTGQRASVPAIRDEGSGDVRFVNPRLGKFPGVWEKMMVDGWEEARGLLVSVTPELLRGSGVDIRDVMIV